MEECSGEGGHAGEPRQETPGRLILITVSVASFSSDDRIALRTVAVQRPHHPAAHRKDKDVASVSVLRDAVAGPCAG